MNSLSDRPFVASDPDLAAEIEKWLNRQGYQIAYGQSSARAERGDLLIGGSESAPIPRAEAA